MLATLLRGFKLHFIWNFPTCDRPKSEVQCELVTVLVWSCWRLVFLCVTAVGRLVVLHDHHAGLRCCIWHHFTSCALPELGLKHPADYRHPQLCLVEYIWRVQHRRSVWSVLSNANTDLQRRIKQIDYLFYLIHSRGINRDTADGKPSKTGVTHLPFRSHNRCGKGEAQCITARWRQSGHLAYKTSYQNPLLRKLRGGATGWENGR